MEWRSHGLPFVMPSIENAAVMPTLEYAAAKFVFNGAYYRKCDGRVRVQLRFFLAFVCLHAEGNSHVFFGLGL